MESNAKYTGNVQTVLGMVRADSLGITLTHEHLLSDMSAWKKEGRP